MAAHLIKDVKTFKKTTLIKRPDNIISSEARLRGEKGFIPSYEKEPKEWMNFIMSDEYMRIWFKERADYEREIYTIKETRKEEKKIQRRYVQKVMHKKQTPCKVLPKIELKRFKDIPARTDHCRKNNNK